MVQFSIWISTFPFGVLFHFFFVPTCPIKVSRWLNWSIKFQKIYIIKITKQWVLRKQLSCCLIVSSFSKQKERKINKLQFSAENSWDWSRFISTFLKTWDKLNDFLFLNYYFTFPNSCNNWILKNFFTFNKYKLNFVKNIILAEQ